MQVIVVDDDVGVVLRRAFTEVSHLAADISLVQRRGGIRRIERGAALRAARHRHVEIDFEKYREVPKGSKLGAMQEDAIDNERGCRRRLLRQWIKRAVVIEIKTFCDVSAGAARTQGLEQ